MSELKDLQHARDTAREQLKTIFTEAKTDEGVHDFRRVKSVPGLDGVEGTDRSIRVAEAVRSKNDELNALQIKVETLQAAEKAGSDFDHAENTPANVPSHPGQKQRKSAGQQMTEHAIYKRWLGGERDGAIEIPDYGLKELKTLFETGAGWGPESVRLPGFVDAVTRPLEIIDIIPTGQTGQAQVVYMEETTRTHSSAETAAGGVYNESAFALTEKTSAVRKITDSIPVTDEQLEDVAMAESYLDGRLRFGLRQRLDSQILVGDGTAPNLEGILNKAGIQTQAKGTDPVPDAIFKAMTKLRLVGRVMPTHVVMNPNDWQGIRLLRTADGIYIWGNPSESGPERIWGLPVVQSSAQTENTGLVGSFEPAWISLFERRGIVIERGFTGSQFTEGKQTLRGSLRTALSIFRPAAFATVTGI